MNTSVSAPLVSQAPDQATAAAVALLRRMIGPRAQAFTVAAIPSAGDRNVFEVESVGGRIVLRGDTGVSIASAFNHYLKEIAHGHVSWCGDQLDLPEPLPPVPALIRIETPHRYRVMFNYCTYNYSAAFWDWPRWERELDVLAMNGINAPLGVIGLEGVWYHTLRREGYTDAAARQFLVGPAFSAWQWMTNIEGHGGPLSLAAIEQRVALGQRWLNRAHELGMTPIRQGFSGGVPRDLPDHRPGIASALQGSWLGFPGSRQLDVTDPYFATIAATFMEESQRLFGHQDHLWAADPFHESEPPTPGEAYLEDVGRGIYTAMTLHDPQAVWVMQGWTPQEAIARVVPKGRLLFLDLAGNRSDFWGHDFVLGQLHNFGGRTNLHGDLPRILANPFAHQRATHPACQGLGLFPEGIGQNPVFYEAVFDQVWRSGPTDPERWLAAYARRRYGVDAPALTEAWMLLLRAGPYGPDPEINEMSSMVAARPALVPKKSGPNNGFKIPYPPLNLLDALDLLLGERERAGAKDAYRYDVVDLTRQVLSNYTQVLQPQIRDAYLARDGAAFAAATERFHQVLTDLDTLLATRPEFLFGRWLADARARGTTPEEAERFVQNAATLVTLWGPAPFGEPTTELVDYAWREWSGLISRYYLPRWQCFHAFLAESIDRGDYRDPPAQRFGRESWRQNALYDRLADLECAVALHPPRDLPTAPVGDALEVAVRVLDRHRAAIRTA